MHNWSTDIKKFKNNQPQKYEIWELSQLINYGLDGTKLDRYKVKKYWNTLKNMIDPNTKTYFEFMLWGKRPSSKNIIRNFWSWS